MKEIGEDIVKYKGFLGGVTLILTSIGVIIMFFKTWILSKLGLPT